MRLKATLAASALATAALVGAACDGDLFHSTAFDTLCTVDASTKGCPQPPITTLCAADHAAALSRAEHACAWLAACEGPMGENRTGQCIANALMAYDCDANPNRKPAGDMYQFWLTLAQARDCAGVLAAVAPGTPTQAQSCKSSSSPHTGCGVGSANNPGNPNSRAECQSVGDTPALYESCLAYGKACAASPTNDLSQCLGPEGRLCSVTRCKGQGLVNCDNDAGLDHGLDCSQLGDGTCVATGAAPSCKPSSTTVRAATTSVTCDLNDIATGSITGFEEHVDCKVFAGVVDGGAPQGTTCVPVDGGGAGTEPRNACQGPSGCKDDACDKTVLRACVQGNEVRFDCRDVGLSACDPSAKTLEDGAHAACKL